MRSIGSELLSVAEVLAIPLAIAAVFPLDAVRFSASGGARPAVRPTASVVFLDDAEATRVLRAARSGSRSGGGGRTYINLLSSELPAAESKPTAAIESRRSPSAPPVLEGGIPPFLPSRRASAPARIPAEATKDEPPFSRNELLKLN